jgi:hypothetical protein
VFSFTDFCFNKSVRSGTLLSKSTTTFGLTSTTMLLLTKEKPLMADDKPGLPPIETFNIQTLNLLDLFQVKAPGQGLIPQASAGDLTGKACTAKLPTIELAEQLKKGCVLEGGTGTTFTELPSVYNVPASTPPFLRAVEGGPPGEVKADNTNNQSTSGVEGGGTPERNLESIRVHKALQNAPMDGNVSKAEGSAVNALKDLVLAIQKNGPDWNQREARQHDEARILSQIPPEHMQAVLGALNKSLAGTNYRLASDPKTGEVWMGEKFADGQVIDHYVVYDPKRKNSK